MTLIYALAALGACTIAYGAFRLVRTISSYTGPGLWSLRRGPIRSIHG